MRNNQNYKDMKTNETLFGHVPYVSPKMDVTELFFEGVLCASDSGNDNGATTEEWGYVDLSNL